MRPGVRLLSLVQLAWLTQAAFAQTRNAGQETTVEFVAPWPPWVTIIVLTLAAIFTYGLYYREQTEFRTWVKFGLATLRFALICLVVWMMYGYTIRPFRTDLPDLLVIVDTSNSMTTVDAGYAGENDSLASRQATALRELKLTEPTRLNLAKTILLGNDQVLPKFLSENYQPKLITLDSTANSEGELTEAIQGLVANADVSQLGLTLRKALQQQRGRPVAAIVYLTDGVTTDGPPVSEIAAEAKHRDIPLHIVGLGSELPPRDLRIGDLLVDDVVFVGDLVSFDFTLSADGFENEQIEVSVRRADGVGSPVTGQVEVTGSDAKSMRLAYKAEEKGTFEFIVDVPPRNGEVTTENNQLRATVEVRDEQTRVLLVQSYPSYEYHYLKTLLERAQRANSGSGKPTIEVSVLLQDADPEFADTDISAIRSFPSREELFKYDICIFGDVNPGFLGSQSLADLRDFVIERGRGFIGIAGSRYFPSTYADTPLAEILPFEVRNSLTPPQDLPIETGFRPRITRLGHRMPSMQLAVDPERNNEIWSELPELYWLLEVDTLKPGVRVLSEHPERTNTSGRPLPVTTLSYVGAGKVLFQNTDDSWRWRIGRGDEFFGRYWRQSIRYLSRFKLGEGRNIELTSDRELYDRGQIVRLRARFFDERLAPNDDSGVVVMLEQKDRGQRQLMLKRDSTERGIYTSDLANLATGEYHAWISEPASIGEPPFADFEISTPNAEMTRLQMDSADLRKAASVSGGEFYTWETAASLVNDLPRGRQVRIEPLPPEPIWNSWKCALAFMGVLLAEWLLRRRVGMV